MSSNTDHEAMDCRPGCGACCIAPSIAGPIPHMPEGKPAGVRCANLDADNLCRLWGTDELPAVCRGFKPMRSVCGDSREEALLRLRVLEEATASSAFSGGNAEKNTDQWPRIGRGSG